MKRILAFILIILFSISFVGCDEKNLTFYAPDGAPALAISKLITEKNDLGCESLEYSVVTSAKIKTALMAKEFDIGIVPLNIASEVITGKDYKIVGTITHGNLYIMQGSGDAITELNGLKGKIVGVIGRGLVPDLTFRALLKRANIEVSVVNALTDTVDSDKIGVIYYSDAQGLLPLVKQKKIAYGLLPEPASTKSGANFLLDIQELWNNETKSFPQAVVVVKSSILTKSLYNEIVSALNENAEWISANIADAVTAINSVIEGESSLSVGNLNASVIEHCNIYFKSAKECKNEIVTYLNEIAQLDELAHYNTSDKVFYLG